MNVKSLGARLSELLGLASAPVALAFRPAAPAGVSRVERPGPAGCAYWKLAAEGNVFYTEAADHYHCPVGSYTHGVELPPAQARELQQVIGTFVGLQYIKMEEVATLPRRTEAFGVAVYAPLAESPVDPDVVLVRGNARQIMLMAEALGYDTAPMEGFLEDKVKATLGIPERVRVVALLAIGRRKGEDKPYGGRFPLGRVFFAEEWGKGIEL